MIRTAARFDPLHSLQQMAELIAQISGESVDTARRRLKFEFEHPGRSVAQDFARHGGPAYKWGPHLESFYNQTNAFLYELAVWNRNSVKARMRRWTSRLLARQGSSLDVLSIGDGLGFDCLYFARKGHRVTYFELPGLSERFARELFSRNGAQIPILTDPSAIETGAYDAITCFDVLEHVPDPAAMVKTLASYLRPGGRLFVSAPFYMVLPWYPTHLQASRRFSGSVTLYEQAGLRLVDGRFDWCPIVLAKPDSDDLPRPKRGALAVRLTAPVLMLGRFGAWPFCPVHLIRKLCNRPF
jgi:2-polyprenyl-3-methyl-5-hydroxy-6-metoxy-1,4-benzoquinol methylase